MRKNLAVALTTLFTVGSIGTAFAAEDSFTDVPKNHWSYSAVKALVKSGVVKGYDDHTFQGDRGISRYEMAVIVAKAMDNIDKADAPTKKLVDKMVKEYGKELNNMKVRVAKLEKRVAAIKPDPIDWSGSNFSVTSHHMSMKGSNGKSFTNQYINGYNYGYGPSNNARNPDTFIFHTQLYLTSRVSQGWNVQGIMDASRNQYGTGIIETKYHTDGSLDLTTYRAFGKVGVGNMSVGHERFNVIKGLVSDTYMTGFNYALDGKVKLKFYNGKLDNPANTNYTFATDINHYQGINVTALTLEYPYKDKTNFYGAFFSTRSFNDDYQAAKIWETAFDTKLSPVLTLSGDYAQSNRSDNNKAYAVGVAYKQADRKVIKSRGLKAEYVSIEARAAINSGYDFQNYQVSKTSNSSGVLQSAVLGDVTWDAVNSKQTLNSTNGQRGYQLTYQYVPFKDSVFTARYLAAKPINGHAYDNIKWITTQMQFYF